MSLRAADVQSSTSRRSLRDSVAEQALFGLLTLFRLLAHCALAILLIRSLFESLGIAGFVLGFCLLLPGIYDEATWFAIIWSSIEIPPSSIPRGRVAAVTTFVPKSESLETLQHSIEALVALEQQHDTWVLDEGDSQEVKELCERFGARHFSRKTRADLTTGIGKLAARTKHGNYNAWLNEVGFSEYDFVAAFDPDHLPDQRYLLRMLPAFADSSVAYAQAPQAYRNQDSGFVAAGAAEETYVYHGIVQPAAASRGYVVLIGSHNVHRIEALREVGGFAEHDADDLSLTLRYQNAGWRGVHVPEVLVRGLAPENWTDYFNQQIRWARSTFDLKRREESFSSKRSVTSRVIGFLQGIRYLSDALFVIAVLLLLELGLTGHHTAYSLWITSVISVLIIATNAYRRRFFLEPATETGFPWRAYTLRVLKWPWTIKAFADVLLRRKVPYLVTPKQATPRKDSSAWRFLIPHLGILVIIFGSMLFSVIRSSGLSAIHLIAGMYVAIVGLICFAVIWHSRGELTRGGATAQASGVSSALLLCTCILAACGTAVWSFFGCGGTVVTTDAARHLMNGVFLFDWLRSDQLLKPASFAVRYYSRLPALSIPYHPPLFPLVEAAGFSLLGTSFAAARLVLAAIVGSCAFAIVYLGASLTRSITLALAALVALLSLPLTQWVGRDIMLEWPALLCVLLAMLRLWLSGPELSMKHALQYGLLAAAGIWTKQTFFLAAVPLVCMLLMSKRVRLRSAAVWVATAVPVIAIAGLLLLTNKAGWTGLPKHWAPQTLQSRFGYFVAQLPSIAVISGAFVLTLLTVTVCLALLRGKGLAFRESLLLSWIVSEVAVALILPAFEVRYLFFAFPAGLYLIAIAWSALARRTRWPMLTRTSALIAALGIMVALWRPPIFLSGPERIAQAAEAAQLKTILYFGVTNGSFIFEQRLRHSDLGTAVLRGDKLFASAVDADALKAFAKQYGIQALAVEYDRAQTGWPVWKASVQLPVISETTVESSDWTLRGRIVLYRLPGDGNPAVPLQQQISPSGKSIQLTF
jgi:cellulose synthase/poly-beta-1,6-N-acetylglucosamine synthase-like glycosyltransferase